nr:hypothetical protein HmN_000989300 [Hymenolepis microstoma]
MSLPANANFPCPSDSRLSPPGLANLLTNANGSGSVPPEWLFSAGRSLLDASDTTDQLTLPPSNWKLTSIGNGSEGIIGRSPPILPLSNMTASNLPSSVNELCSPRGRSRDAARRLANKRCIGDISRTDGKESNEVLRGIDIGIPPFRRLYLLGLIRGDLLHLNISGNSRKLLTPILTPPRLYHTLNNMTDLPKPFTGLTTNRKYCLDAR